MRVEGGKNALWLFCILFVSLILTGCGKKLTDQEYLQNARDHWEQGNFRTSMIEVKNALQINPKNSEARLLLGQVYLKLNQGAAGEKEIRVAAKLGMSNSHTMKPLSKALLLQNKFQEVIRLINLTQIEASTERAELYVILGRAYFGLKEADKARQSFEHALRTDSGVKGGYLGLAKVAMVNNQIELALQYIEQAIKQQPESYESILIKGELNFLQNKNTQAEEIFTKLVMQVNQGNKNSNYYVAAHIGLIKAKLVLNKFNEAVSVADGLVKKFPGHPAANYYRALSAYQKGDLKTSEIYLHNVLKIVPNHMPSFYLLGAINYAQKNYELTVEYLGKYVANVRDPENNATQMLASAHMNLNQPDEAIEILTQAQAANPEDPQILAMLGDVALSEGEHAAGRNYLEKAVSADPDNPRVRTTLARAYLSLGKVEQGIKELQKSLNQDAYQQQAQLLLLRVYFRQKDFKNALLVAEKLLKQNPDDVKIYNLIGGIYAAKRDFGSSKNYFEKALKLKPDNKLAMLNLARIDFTLGDLKNARRRYDAILVVDGNDFSAIMGLVQVFERIGEDDKALELLQRTLLSHPDVLTSALLLGKYYLKKREFAKAVDLLTNTDKRFPDNVQLIFQLGLANLGLGKYELALQNMQQVLTLQPRTAKAYFYLALTYDKQKDSKNARSSLKKALDIEPTYFAAASMLTQLEIRAGRNAGALKFVRGLQKGYPKSVIGFVLEGDIHIQQFRYLDAAAAYKKALLLSNIVELVVKRSMALLKAKKAAQAIAELEGWLIDHPQDLSVQRLLATVYHESGNKSKAIKYYENVLNVQPGNLISLNNLALLYFEKKNTKALELAEQAYQIKSNAITADTLGWIKLNQGDNLAGLKLLKQAAKEAPQFHEIQYHLAVAYARNGQKNEARKILQEILKDKTPFEGINQARALLSSL